MLTSSLHWVLESLYIRLRIASSAPEDRELRMKILREYNEDNGVLINQPKDIGEALRKANAIPTRTPVTDTIIAEEPESIPEIDGIRLDSTDIQTDEKKQASPKNLTLQFRVHALQASLMTACIASLAVGMGLGSILFTSTTAALVSSAFAIDSAAVLGGLMAGYSNGKKLREKLDNSPDIVTVITPEMQSKLSKQVAESRDND